MPHDPRKFLALFAGAADRALISPSIMPTKVSSQKEMLAHVANHLSGNAKLGIFALRADSTAGWCAVHFGLRASGGAQHDALKYHDSLSGYGVPTYIERIPDVPAATEFRVWMFFEDPIQVERFVPVVRASIMQAGLDEGIPSVPGEFELLTGDAQSLWLPYFGGTPSSAFVNRAMRRVGDAKTFIGVVRRISPADFEDFETAVFPSMSAMWDPRANFIGSAQGLEKVIQNCPFLKWCEDNADNGIPEPLMLALMANLCRFGPDGTHTLIEIARRRPGRFDEVAFTNRLASMYGVYGPTTYEAIKAIGWPGDIPSWPASPAGWGIYLDIDLLIARWKDLDEDQLGVEIGTHFREDFNHMSYEDQIKWSDRLHVDIGLPRTFLRSLAAKVTSRSNFSGWKLKSLLSAAKEYKIAPPAVGKMMLNWLIANGGLVFKDRSGNLMISWTGSDIKVGDNQDFKDFLYTEGGVTLRTRGISEVVEAFQSEASILAKSQATSARVKVASAKGKSAKSAVTAKGKKRGDK